MPEIDIRDLQGQDIDHALITKAAGATARAQDTPIDEISLVLVDNARIRQLNQRLLNRDRPTDVIAFEAEEDPDGLRRAEAYISVEQAQIQAQQQGHTIQYELAFLVAHAVLHMLGFSDITQAGRQEMLQTQKAIIGQFEEFDAIE